MCFCVPICVGAVDYASHLYNDIRFPLKTFPQKNPPTPSTVNKKEEEGTNKMIKERESEARTSDTCLPSSRRGASNPVRPFMEEKEWENGKRSADNTQRERKQRGIWRCRVREPVLSLSLCNTD